MKKTTRITALAATLAITFAVSGGAMAQTAPAAAPAAEPVQVVPPAPPADSWDPFSRSADRAYLTNTGGFVRSDGVTKVTVARVPLNAPAGDLGYSAYEIELRCGAKQSRTTATIEYGPDGVQTDRFDDPEDWGPYSAQSRDGYLSQVACDGARAEQNWPSIKAFIDAGKP